MFINNLQRQINRIWNLVISKDWILFSGVGGKVGDFRTHIGDVICLNIEIVKIILPRIFSSKL